MAPSLYYTGGDDVSALVFDSGSSLTRAGWAGEDTPRTVFPSDVGLVSGPGVPKRKDGRATTFARGEGGISTWHPHTDIVNPFKDGLVNDWDAYEQLLSYAFEDVLRAKAENQALDHPLLVTEPAWNTRELREKATELAFEKLGVPAFFLAKDAVLAAFAQGKATALVVDSGSATTSVVPVYEGYAIKKAVTKQSLGGDLLSQQSQLLLRDKFQFSVTPQYKIKRKGFVDAGKQPDVTLIERENTSSSFHRYHVLRTINDWKETVCQVSEVAFHEESLAIRPAKSYEFPDGYNNAFGAERFRLPEIMFDPKSALADPDNPVPPEAVGVQNLVHASAQACDPDLRAIMYGSIVLTGGNTCFAGFPDRMNNELTKLVPGPKIRIQAPGSMSERRFGAWIGGSILASLGTFHQLWISKQEYEENGKQFVEKRCQ